VHRFTLIVGQPFPAEVTAGNRIEVTDVGGRSFHRGQLPGDETTKHQAR
jgi:hypothetical protein